MLARGLRKQGVHSIRGDLVGDDSFFDDEARGLTGQMLGVSEFSTRRLGRCRCILIAYRSSPVLACNQALLIVHT
ncbi:MAG: hypothetical protein ACRERE_14765 [Candidatus Entotheonellia bacterium]